MGIHRVLLVSQDRWLVDKVREVLDDAGVETEIALSGAVAASVAVERRVDLLLVDEAVEDFHMVQKIKDPVAPTYRLPAVVIAAEAELVREDVQKLIPFAVFPREFDPEELLVKVLRAIEFGDRLAKRGKRVVA